MVDLDRLLPIPLLATLQETTVAVLAELLASDELTVEAPASAEDEPDPAKQKIEALEAKIAWDSDSFRGKSLDEWMGFQHKTAAECFKVFLAIYGEPPESIEYPADFVGDGVGFYESMKGALPYALRVLQGKAPIPTRPDPRRVFLTAVWYVYELRDEIGQQEAKEVLQGLEPLLSFLEEKAAGSGD